MRVAIDTGGTFTDCLFLHRGQLQILKVFSTPDNPARAIARVLDEVRARFGRNQGIELLHGTTVGTNALLERRGGRIALITTAGFEDVLVIGRQARPRLYDLFVTRAPALVPRARRLGARERIAADGRVLEPLSGPALRWLVGRLERIRPQAVAVCLLFSFSNPAHERRIARALRPLERRLGMSVTLSHQILPEFREYERTSTVAANAYLMPVMGRYLSEVEKIVNPSTPAGLASAVRLSLTPRQARGDPELAERVTVPMVRLALTMPSESRGSENRGTPRGAGRRVHVMQSSGGTIAARTAASQPVRTILSGPAGGVVGAGYVAELAGLERVISFDMGGTSTDVALLEGELPVTTEGAVGEIPIAVPMLDIHSVGAGGGSIAWFDRGGALRVGPASAGADPGPVCYGRGEDPTVTDAHLVLGRLDPERFLGGEWRLDAPRAERYLERARRGRGFRDLKEFAAGILAVANATMERAMRVISIERGHDPRAFTLVAFGGAGGLHAAELASALRIPRVLVPPFPGALSALGMLRSDVVKDYSRTVLLPVDDTGGKRTLAPKLRRAFRPLIETARQELAREGFSPGRQRLLPRLDLRYRGQGYEITVPYNRQAVSPVPKHRDGRVGRHLGFLDAFHRAHERRYGYADPARPVEVVTVRLRAVGITSKPSLERARRRSRTVRARPHRTAPVWFAGRLMPTAFFLREELLRGQRISGPAVVAEYSATTVVPPRWQLGVDAYENLILESAAGRW